MTSQDASTILALATLAAAADGEQDASELAQLTETASALGLTNPSAIMAEVESGALTLALLAERLSTPEARQLAYDTAAAVCHADGWINPSEGAFLRQLALAVHADTGDAKLAFAEVTSIQATPTTLVLDKQGRVAARVIGPIGSASILETLVQDALDEK